MDSCLMSEHITRISRRSVQMNFFYMLQPSFYRWFGSAKKDLWKRLQPFWVAILRNVLSALAASFVESSQTLLVITYLSLMTGTGDVQYYLESHTLHKLSWQRGFNLLKNNEPIFCWSIMRQHWVCLVLSSTKYYSPLSIRSQPRPK